MSILANTRASLSTVAPEPVHPPALVLQTYSYEERRTILPELLDALDMAGCWLVDRKSVSPTQMVLRLELQLRSALELYTALIRSGLELTRGSHLGMTGLCTVRQYQRRAREPYRTLEVRLEVSFLDEIDVSAALLPQAARA